MNLILGASTNLSEMDLTPFIQSLSQTAYNGDVVFFIPDTEMELTKNREMSVQRGLD